MLDFLLQATALPDLHPALVHFPIALAAVALLFEAAALLWRERAGQAALALWWLAGLGAGAAYWAGRSAADGLGLVTPEVERAVGAHADSAWWTLLALGAVVVLRSAAAATLTGRSVALTGCVLGLLVQPLIVRTADLGGALVYRHAVGVSARAQPPFGGVSGDPDAAEPSPPLRADLTRDETGGLRWIPRPGDETVWGRVLEKDGATLVADVLPEGPGLRFSVAGQGALRLPVVGADLRIVAVVDTTGFRGRVGPGLLAERGDRGLLLLSDAGGEVQFVRIQGGEETVIDTASGGSTGQPLRLTLSVSGSHLRGHLGDPLAVHAHGDLGKGLHAALVLRGEGEIIVLSVEVTAGEDS